MQWGMLHFPTLHSAKPRPTCPALPYTVRALPYTVPVPCPALARVVRDEAPRRRDQTRTVCCRPLARVLPGHAATPALLPRGGWGASVAVMPCPALPCPSQGETRRGESRRGEARRGEARRGESSLVLWPCPLARLVWPRVGGKQRSGLASGEAGESSAYCVRP